jgi:hypothetical protein
MQVNLQASQSRHGAPLLGQCTAQVGEVEVSAVSNARTSEGGAHAWILIVQRCQTTPPWWG